MTGYELSDKLMKDVFDWSDSELPIRVALWNHFMESNDSNTMETSKAVKPLLDLSEDDLKTKVTELLKK